MGMAKPLIYIVTMETASSRVVFAEGRVTYTFTNIKILHTNTHFGALHTNTLTHTYARARNYAKTNELVMHRPGLTSNAKKDSFIVDQ